MKWQTAQNIVNKMVCGGYSVKLRRRGNVISPDTWKALVNILLSYYDAESVSISYASNRLACISAMRHSGDELFSCNVELY